MADPVDLATALADYSDEPSFAGLPARDLTPAQAFDLLMHHVQQGEIELAETFKFDTHGKVTYPRPGAQLKVRTSMAGVDYLQASTANTQEFAGAHATPTFTPTPEFAIVLYRFAKFLNTGRWGARRIVFGGIGHGSEAKKANALQNCHEVGTCVDFYGAYTTAGAFDVFADWSEVPIYDAVGNLRPHQPKRGDRWGNATSTFYRIRNGSNPAYDFFADVYDFVYQQCSVGSTDVGALRQGQPVLPGKIIHPDYPTPNLREAHRQHMHFQLGEAYFKR